MFNTLDNLSLLKQRISAERFSTEATSDIVMLHLSENHDFGKQLFHKILNKGLLKPLQSESAEAAQ